LIFDHTRLVGNIANGVLNIPAAEAIGHEISILTNGTIHKNLYSYGVVRLVSSSDSLSFFHKIYHGSKFIKIKYHPHTFLSPLNSPERSSCDIYVDGQINNLEIRHDRSDHWQLLNQAVQKLNNFKNNELQEDGLLER